MHSKVETKDYALLIAKFFAAFGKEGPNFKLMRDVFMEELIELDYDILEAQLKDLIKKFKPGFSQGMPYLADIVPPVKHLMDKRREGLIQTQR